MSGGGGGGGKLLLSSSLSSGRAPLEWTSSRGAGLSRKRGQILQEFFCLRGANLASTRAGRAHESPPSPMSLIGLGGPAGRPIMRLTRLAQIRLGPATCLIGAGFGGRRILQNLKTGQVLLVFSLAPLLPTLGHTHAESARAQNVTRRRTNPLAPGGAPGALCAFASLMSRRLDRSARKVAGAQLARLSNCRVSLSLAVVVAVGVFARALGLFAH